MWCSGYGRAERMDGLWKGKQIRKEMTQAMWLYLKRVNFVPIFVRLSSD